jgi:DNA primase
MFLDTLVKNFNRSIHRYPEVLKYLKSREVTDEEISKFCIGYNKIILVPDDPDNLDRDAFMNECFGGRKLENKLIFPFKNSIGNVVGLIGRAIDTKEFKIFTTKQAEFEGFFFGLYEALPSIYKENRAYIVEGPFDYLALSKVLPNTVSTLTSKINDAQYDFLRMYCDEIVTVFDSDAAGDKGREKAEARAGVLSKNRVQSINLGYKDPAKILEEMKFKKFKEYILKKTKEIF